MTSALLPSATIVNISSLGPRPFPDKTCRPYLEARNVEQTPLTERLCDQSFLHFTWDSTASKLLPHGADKFLSLFFVPHQLIPWQIWRPVGSAEEKKVQTNDYKTDWEDSAIFSQLQEHYGQKGRKSPKPNLYPWNTFNHLFGIPVGLP